MTHTCTENMSRGSCDAVWSIEVIVSEGTGISLLKWISAFMIVQRGCKMTFLESSAWSEGPTSKPDIYLMCCINNLKMSFL